MISIGSEIQDHQIPVAQSSAEDTEKRTLYLNEDYQAKRKLWISLLTVSIIFALFVSFVALWCFYSEIAIDFLPYVLGFGFAIVLSTALCLFFFFPVSPKSIRSKLSDFVSKKKRISRKWLQNTLYVKTNKQKVLLIDPESLTWWCLEIDKK